MKVYDIRAAIRIKDKTSLIISIDAEDFDKTQQFFMTKMFNKLKIEGTFFSLLKDIYEKLTANITPNNERLSIFSLISETKQGSLLSLQIFNIILEFLAREIRQENGNKRHPDRTGRSKTICL